MSSDRTLPARSVVCLHGLGRSPSDWDGVVAELGAFGDVRTPTVPRHPSAATRRAGANVDAGAIIIGHSLGAVTALRLAAHATRPLRALVLTGCFFPPARNARTVRASALDYIAHRVAYVRSLGRPGAAGDSRAGTTAALASLLGLAVRRREFDAVAADVGSPVLVVHARDDHHVPLDFALAAAVRRRLWTVHIMERGGHHAHVTRPTEWINAVAPWLEGLT
ncbi:MAG: alpha/beta fold hydrolase [Solirubrobacteraceae bacterium]